ncbi:MAG: TCR/Tet family MFS transporter [Verrucomicrobiaceae bacterium]|nr:TCR/Tet family MFS transporter [Verrucomicrobiaceae bacterium]
MGFILVTLVLDILGIGLIVPILPELVKSMTGGDTAAASDMSGWLGALYALMQFLFAPLLGCLSDKVGRRPVILISQFGLALDYILLAWAPTMSWFFVGRIIAGITGANFAAATAYVADVSAPEKRAANFGLIGAAFGVGFIIGPLLGGVLGQWGLRVPFLVAGCLTALNWVYGCFILPESLKMENRQDLNWERANPLGAFWELTKRPTVFSLAMCAFLSFVAHQVYPSIWVLYTGFRYGWSPMQNSVSLAVVGVCAAVVQGWLTGKVVKRVGEWRTAVIGLLVTALGYIAYGLASEGWMIYPLVVLGSIGGLAGPAVQGLISNSVGDDEQGAVQGAITSLESVSGVVGPLIVTSLFSYFIRPTAPFVLPGAPFFVSALIALAALAVAMSGHRQALRRQG